VAAEAGSYAQAIEMLRTNDINVVVADLSMPGRDGIDLISHIKASNPVVSILVLNECTRIASMRRVRCARAPRGT